MRNQATISCLAHSIGETFDYDNKVSFPLESELRSQYGDDFYDAFYEYFENEWFSAIGEAIQFLETSDVFSDAIRCASKKTGVVLLDTGNWDGEEWDLLDPENYEDADNAVEKPPEWLVSALSNCVI